MGLHRAGFEVVGVDIKPQPRYPFTFFQADALTFDLSGFDFIWASPPCQAHTSMKSMYNAKPHPDLIPETRARLKANGVPYVIENVEGAPLNGAVKLCGSMFGLGAKGAVLRRHRYFETGHWKLLAPVACKHPRGEKTIGIYGEGVRDSRRKYDKTIPEFTVVDGRAAMDCPWMTLAELCEAIPPAYAEFIGRIAVDHIEAERTPAGNRMAFARDSALTDTERLVQLWRELREKIHAAIESDGELEPLHAAQRYLCTQIVRTVEVYAE